MRLILFLLALLCAIGEAAPPPAEGEDLLVVAAHRSLLDSLIHQPISQNQTISEYLRGVVMRGTALTSGTLTAQPFPAADGIGLALQFQSTTDATSLNSTSARSDVQVFFGWNILTTALTRKEIVLRERGFELRPARTEAQSRITIKSVNATSQGLFWRFKNWVAQRRAWQELNTTKPQNEREAAARISRELNQTIDRRAEEELPPLQRKYFRYVYDLLIKSGLLGGRLSMGSSDSWLAVVATNGPRIKMVDVRKLEGLNEPVARSAPLQVRVSAALAERLAAERLGGVHITDVELAEAFNLIRRPDDSYQGAVVAPEEVLLTLDDKRPLEMLLEEDRITAIMHASEVETRGTVTRDVKLRQTVVIRQQAGGPRLELDPSMVQTEGLPPPLAEHVSQRFSDIVRRLSAANGKGSLLAGLSSISLRTLSARHNRLTAGLMIGKKP